jgi:hypothetical protein
VKAHSTSSTTAILGAPHDWDETANGTCEGLPITQSDFGVMFSYWRPTWRERFALIFGRSLRLGIFGRGHPPVSLDLLT